MKPEEGDRIQPFGWILGAVLLVVVACGGGIISPGMPVAERGEVSYMAFDSVSIVGRELTVKFVGMAVYDPDNPCSAKYHVDVSEEEGILQVGVWEEPHPKRGETFCTLEGHFLEEKVFLDSEYRGHVVQDLAGSLRSLRPPDTLPLVRPQQGWVEVSGEDIRGYPGGWAVTYRRDGVAVGVTLLHFPDGGAIEALHHGMELERITDGTVTYVLWSERGLAAGVTWETNGAENMLYAEAETGLSPDELIGWLR